MNCLVTAIGSFSGEAVISALKRNCAARVIGCDIYPCACLPVCSEVDAFYQVPKVYESERYIEKLIEMIRAEKVDFIIPLTDPEVDLLSDQRSIIEAEGVKICLPDKEAVDICRRKEILHKFFQEDLYIDVIPTFEALNFQPNVCDLPLIAKPKKGRSSEGVFIISTQDDLGPFIKRADYIVQPLLQGDVFTVDCVRDRKHKRSFAVPRKELIRTSNGAGLSVEVAPNVGLTAKAQYIAEKLDINGCINMEFIHSNGQYFLMDINPRFSAGVSFSILAGYDMVSNHMSCFLGQEIQGPIWPKTMTIVKQLTDIVTKIEGNDVPESRCRKNRP